MKRKFFSNILLLASLAVYSQTSLSPSSPAGAALARDVNVPVNMYSGLAQIQVPLMTLPHPNGASIPVTLGYHPGGIKVQDVASPVGLGWNLTAGGMITRAVKGIPDLEGNFYSGDNDFDEIDDGDLDGEHDIFYFQLPNGRSGRFILDKDGTTAHTIPAQDLEITKTGTLSSGSWTIVDEAGIRYSFGTSTRESTEIYEMDENESYPSTATRSYVSTWYIDLVEFPNHTQSVNFYYTTYSSYSYEYYRSVKEVDWKNCNGTPMHQVVNSIIRKVNTKLKVLQPKYLNRIQIGEASMYFDWSTVRQDLPQARALSKIELKYGTELINAYRFYYFYFSAANSAYDEYHSYEDVFNCLPQDCYRLGLASIDFISNGSTLKYRKFNYVEEDLAPNQNPIYDRNALPPRFSANQDHWGFHSPAAYATWDGSRMPQVELPGIGRISNGKLKSPSDAYSQGNMLTSIELQGGGVQEFEYELNQVNGAPVGGLRIKSICITSENDSYCRTFEYLKGENFNQPVYHYTVYDHNGDIGIAIDDSSLPTSCHRFFTVISSESYNDLFDLNGSHIGYEKVKETLPNGSFHIYEFFGFNDYADALPDIDFYEGGTFLAKWLNKNDVFLNEQIGPPFPSTTSYAWKRGQLKSKKSYNAGDDPVIDDPIFAEVYDYYFNNTTLYNISNRAVTNFTPQPGNVASSGLFSEFINFVCGGTCIDPANLYLVGKYDHIIAPFQLKSRIVTATEGDGISSSYTQVNTYHSTNRTFLDNQTIFYPDGSKQKTEYKYSFDISTATPGSATDEAWGYYKMKARSIIGNPVQVVNKYALPGQPYRITGASFNTFLEVGTNIAPYHTYALEIEDPIAEGTLAEVSTNYSVSPVRLEYDDRFELETTSRYYTDGNLWYTIAPDGTRTDYTWGYNNSLITSETVNSEFTTTYTHIPLVGVETVTDPNGKMLKYEYDDFNRLRMVRDENDNILERHRYHYAGDDESITSTININLPPGQQSGEKNKGVNFSSNQTLTYYSKTKYVWDFGDGEVSQAFGSSASHIYDEVGTFIVKLTLINPDFDPIQVSRAVCITLDGGACTALPD